MRWNYTKTLLILAVAYSITGAAGGYLVGLQKWETPLAGLFWIPVLGAFFAVPADIIAWLKERRASGRAAGTSPRPPS